jgi:hypothetical protein
MIAFWQGSLAAILHPQTRAERVWLTNNWKDDIPKARVPRMQSP